MLEKQKDLIRTIILSASIIIASLVLAFAINKGARYIGDAVGSGLSHIGANLPATAIDREFQFGEFMSEYDAAAFLGVATYDFSTFVQSGELDGTFTIIESSYVFSKEKLTQWFKNRIENE